MRLNPGETPHQTLYKSLHKSADRRKWEDLFLFQLRTAGLPKPREQFKFHDTRRWTTDFAWPEKRLIVEIEGGIWRRGGGAHTHPSNVLRDIEKYNAAALLGYRLFRFSDRELKNGEAMRIMKLVL